MQRAAARAQSPPGNVDALLNLYCSARGKQREQGFASTSRAAEIAGVSQRTIQLWIEFGALSAIRIGRNYRVSLDSLREFLLGTNAH